MKEGFLLVVSGPSGVGKGTVCENLLSKGVDLKYSISATTRVKRDSEIDGKNYFFYSDEEFQASIERQDLLEYAKVHGNFYGTPKKYVLDNIASGNIVLLEIDVQGAMQVKKNFTNAVYIFLLPPNMNELRERIFHRGTEDSKSIQLRLENSKKELAYLDQYDYGVINDTVDNATEKIIGIIEAEKLRISHNDYGFLFEEEEYD